MRMLLPLLLLGACKKADDSGFPLVPFSFPDPEAHPDPRGPGGPTATFADADLWQNCAYLPGGEQDIDHHNEVAMYRGHLVLPWSPEWASGGLSFYEIDDPCHPVKVSDGWTMDMRETHAIGFSHVADGAHAGDWAFVTAALGTMAWNITDEAAPEPVGRIDLEGVGYPDAYARVVFSVFVQYPWLYAAGSDNGLYVLDVTDPTAPEMVTHYQFEPNLRAGMVSVLGNKMLIVSAEQTDAALLDLSDPTDPQLYPGGRFTITDGAGEAREAYAGGMVGNHAVFSRKSGGGGVILFDISDPTAPVYASDFPIPEGNGGYAYMHEGIAFQGNSNRANVIDFTDLEAPMLLGTGYLEGDLDTATPIGNIAVLAVDDESVPDQSSAVMPWSKDPDVRPPRILAVDPPDGASAVATTARIGVGFDEFIEASTVFAGSIRLRDGEGEPVDAWGSGQETIASLVPKEPLQPGTTYTVEVMAGGISDYGGNALTDGFTWSFTTADR